MMKRIGIFIAILLWAATAHAQNISFVNSSTAASPSVATSIVVPVPAGVQNSDGLITCISWYYTGSAPVLTVPGTWTSVQTGAQTGTVNTSMTCMQRLASSEPSSYTFSFTGAASNIGAIMLDYRGVLATGFIDVSGVQGGTTSPVTAPSVTTTANNEWLISIFSAYAAFTGSPVGETQRALVRVNTIGPGGPAPGPGVLGADQLMASPGPTGAKTVGTTNGSTWVGINIAIVPSPTPPPPPISNVNVTGTVWNFYGYPCVACHVSVYPLYPTLNSTSGTGGTLIMNVPPVTVETNSNGVFNASVVGGVTAAVYIKETNALFKANLPTSGTITLAQIQAAQPNVVSAFPPTGNLNMGGNHFTNMSGGQALGDSVAVGTGLDSAQIITASGNYPFPAGATYGEALLIGGGGGGGGGNSGASNGGGGGGGGGVTKCLMLASNGQITVTLGGAGTGGAPTANGTDGQNSVAAQGTASCTALAGVHGTGGSGGGAGSGGAGGATGSVSGLAILLYTTAGASGSNGASGGGGAGGGPLGGAGGAPSGGSGVNGGTGIVVLWFY